MGGGGGRGGEGWLTLLVTLLWVQRVGGAAEVRGLVDAMAKLSWIIIVAFVSRIIIARRFE